MAGQANEKQDCVADYLNRLTPEQLADLRKEFGKIPPYGELAHPRIAITAALNEACHLAFGGYETCRTAYETFRSRCNPGILPESAEKNFRNWAQRATMSGAKFDLFEAACFTVDMYSNKTASFNRWRETLTPYQSWLIEWARAILEQGIFTAPRASDDTGTRRTGGAGSSGYRVGEFIEGFREIQSLGEMDSLCPANPGVAHFIYFRAGLDKPQTFIQAHLRILRPGASRSEYNTFDMLYDFGGQKRFAGGVVIPTQRTVYLMGVQGWGMPGKSEVGRRLSLTNPAEIIALPRDKITEGVEFIPGLTMTTDSTDTLLCSRFALRRTSIRDRNCAGIGVDEVWKLGARLTALDQEEARLAGDAPQPDQSAQESEAKRPEALEAAATRDQMLQSRVRVLSAIINNITARSFVDLQDSKGELTRSAVFNRRVEDALAQLFQDKLGNSIYRDQNGALYEQRLHWRAPALKAE